MTTEDKSRGLSLWEWIRAHFHMRPPEDDEPQSWWIASTAIPLVAAATGPLTNVMSIVALVMPWRSKILSIEPTAAGTSAQEGYPDPHWATVLNAISLCCGIVGNAFLLFNFTQIVRYIIALPVTIVLWFTAAGILCGTTTAIDVYAPPVGIDRVYSQAYWSAVIAAVLYFILSVVLMINMLGYFLGKYPQHFALTGEQRTLILQMTAMVVWLLIGAAIFQRVLKISFADALFFSDVTVLTLGYGNIIPINAVGRGLIWPYAVIGIIILGLVVESIFKFAREVHYDNVIRKHIEQKRQSTFERSVDFQELDSAQQKRPTGGQVITPPDLARQKSEPHRRLHHRPIRNTINALATARRPKILIMREEKDRFEAMRRIQYDTMRFRRWNNLIISIVAFGIVWSCGAVVFWKLEAMTYFESLYFCFTSLLTIGYGDFTPESNPGRPFFVVWSLIAIPTMTMLISEMTDTVVASFKRATEVVADYFVLPQSRVYKTCFGRIPGLAQFLLFRQERKRQERGFPIEGADEPDCGEGADSEEAGQYNNTGSDDLAEAHPRRSLEELVREPTTPELTQQLAFAIRRTSKQAREGKRKRYSYEEWVEFTRLIQFTDPRARTPLQRNQPANEERLSNDEDDYGLLNWDWIGENSPMLAKQTEPEWVLDRLCESLIRYVSTQESGAVEGPDLAEEPTLRKERDIGLDE
ncbi:Ion transport 2 [Penicillium digitatum]|uniref:Ion transport 2 n=1 Tax=Penicillium digitatum TaxID=36651 RepID=A0A7T6XN49_PENDI|nr:Ion transport 2 [Penicillium digitatum]